MTERKRCPYRFCNALVLMVGPDKSVIRKHGYEDVYTCPGSGYDWNMPAMEQDRLMAGRESEMSGS